MAKRVVRRPDWIKADQVEDIHSVSACVSKNFAEYINFWKHNGHWLFNSPSVISELASAHQIELTECSLFYYELYERQYVATSKTWETFASETTFQTNVVVPADATLDGFDVVTFSVGTSPECSPLSCNSLASEIATNRHCLLDSKDEAIRLIEDGHFENSEPGPYRIFAVYSLGWF